MVISKEVAIFSFIHIQDILFGLYFLYMITQELVEFIKTNLQTGVTREQITNTLVSNGWSATDVNEAFLHTAPQGVPVPPMQTVQSMMPANHSKRKILITLLVILVIILIFGGVYIYNNYSKMYQIVVSQPVTDSSNELQPTGAAAANASTSQNQNSTPAVPANAQTQVNSSSNLSQSYSQPEGSFSFKYPASWKLTTTPTRTSGSVTVPSSAVAQILNETTYGSVGISPQPLFSGMTEEQEWNNAVTNQDILSKHGTKINTKIGGYDAIGIMSVSGTITSAAFQIHTPHRITQITEIYSAEQKENVDAVIASIVFH